MRVLTAFAVTVVSAVTVTAADRGGGTITFVPPAGGTKKVVMVGSGPRPAVPAGSQERKNQLWPTVVSTARAHDLDPDLVDLVIRMESGYNPNAVSPKGARGVMQLMPGTARHYGVDDTFDARENIRGGVRYLRDLLARFSANLALALAAYNAGPEAVERHRGVPPYDETQNYVRAILGAYNGSEAVLSGGFGRPARPVKVVVASSGGKVVSNVERAGEAPLGRRLAIR